MNKLVSREGVIRLQCSNCVIINTTVSRSSSDVKQYIEKLTKYSEGGEKIPQIFMLIGPRLLDMSKLMNKEQVLSLLTLELAEIDSQMPVVIIMELPV